MISLKKKMLLAGGKKTLFATNFSEYAVGTTPSDWTKPWSSTGYTTLVQTVSGSISGRALRWSKTAANDFQLLRWDKIPPCKEVEVLYRFRRIEAMTSSQDTLGVMLRGSGSSSATADGAKFTIASQTSSAVYGIANRYTNGSKGGSQIFAPASLAVAVNAWMWVRINYSGSSLKMKKWLSTTSEPASFEAPNAFATPVETTGFVGLINVTENPSVEVDYFAVDIAAKTIPLPI